MTLESSKTLGGIGAILMVIGFLGFFGMAYAGVISLIGIILVLIALKGMADHYQEGGIFNNALYGVITFIVGIVAFVGAIIVLIFMAISTAIDWTDPSSIQTYFMDLNNLWAVLGAAIAALVVLFIFLIVSAVFFKKSLDSLASKSGEKIFGTAGLLWLIGAALSIILVGFILIWVSWILIAIGFFSIKTTTAQPAMVQPPPPAA